MVSKAWLAGCHVQGGGVHTGRRSAAGSSYSLDCGRSAAILSMSLFPRSFICITEDGTQDFTGARQTLCR